MIPSGQKLRGPQLYTQHDIAALTSAASLARAILDELLTKTTPGVTPLDLDFACRQRIESAGAKPILMDVVGDDGRAFGHACSVSVDNAVAHARPDFQPLRAGQLVTIDLMLSINDWHADVADTVVVGGGSHALLHALDAVWEAGLAAIKPGGPWAEVARAMAGAAERNGVRLVQGLAGHGIGMAPHELPALPLVPRPSDPPVILRQGMVFTLEPAITTGSGKIHTEVGDSEDGWSILTTDRAPAVAREALIAVENEQILMLGGSSPGDSGTAPGYNPLRTGLGSGE